MAKLITHKECERAYKQAIRTPWHEYVRRFLMWLEEKRRARVRRKYVKAAKRYGGE